MKCRILFTLVVSALASPLVFGAGVSQGRGDSHNPEGRRDRDDREGRRDRDDLIVPEAWRGTWEVTVAYPEGGPPAHRQRDRHLCEALSSLRVSPVGFRPISTPGSQAGVLTTRMSRRLSRRRYARRHIQLA